MKSSNVPWNQVAHIRPSACHSVRKRSHCRASRHSTQFSTMSRMARRSAVVSSGITFPRHGRACPGHPRLVTATIKAWMPGTRPGMTGEGRMARLQGKTAIVTGGAKGIGAHYSRALAAQGARVMIADIEDGAAVASEIVKTHGKDAAVSERCDVSDEASVQALVASTARRFGRIDILVNNAALYAKLSPRNFNEWDVEVWDKVMAINVRGPYLMVRHVAPHMIAQKSGKIINI